MVEISEFRNISFKKKTECMVCGIKSGDPLITLPGFPLTGIYVKEKVSQKAGFVDQEFYLCKDCGHAQLSNIVDPNILYGESYCFRTSASATAPAANDFFISFIKRVTMEKRFEMVIEIGCSDSYLLKSLRPMADQLIGIDPVSKGKKKALSDDPIEVIADFIENINLGKYMRSKNTLVLCSHTIEHIDDPKAMLGNLFGNSSNDTLFFFQFPSLEILVGNYRFDQIFHQHLHYFSLYSFLHLLDELGGEMLNFEFNPHHWGSLLVAFKKRNKGNTNQSLKSKTQKLCPESVLKKYESFKTRMNHVNRYLESLKGEKVYGYGAALMLPALSYHLENDFSRLECIVDDDKNKDGLFFINLPVSIRAPISLDLRGANILITAIDNSRQILNKAISFNPNRIILPVHVI